MKSHNNKELQNEVIIAINSCTPLIKELANVVINYSHPDFEISLSPDEKYRANQIANAFFNNHQINLGFFYKNFKKNLFRSISPFQEIDYSGVYCMLGGIVVSPLLFFSPCLSMAFYQAIISKQKEYDWFHEISCQLILLRKLSVTMQQNFANKCITKYEALKNRPTLKTQLLIRSLKYWVVIWHDDDPLNDIENYLKDPSNKSSKLYQFLIEELGQVPTIHEEYKEQLAIVKPKID